MGLIDFFKSKKQEGTKFLKPEESGMVLPEKGGVNVSIPGETARTTTGGSVGGRTQTEVIQNISRRGSGGGRRSSSSNISQVIKEEEIAQQKQDSFKPSKGNTIQSQLSPPPSSLQAPSNESVSFERRQFFPALLASVKQGSFNPLDSAMLPKGSERALIFDDKLLGGGKLTRFQIEQARKFGAKETTFGEEQFLIEGKRKEKVEKERRRLQGEIDLGSLNLTSANEQFTNFQTKVYEDNPDIKGIRDKPQTPVRQLFDLALFSNPVTSSIAGAVSSKSDPLKIDLSQLSKGSSIGGATTSRPSLRTASYFLGSTLSSAGKLSQAGKEVTQGEVLLSLDKAQMNQLGVRFPSGKNFIDVSVGEGTVGSTRSLIRSVSLSRDTGGKFLTGGSSQYGVIGKTYFGGKPFFLGGSSEFGAVSKSFGNGKVIPSISKITNFPTTSFSAVSSKKGLVGEAFAYKSDGDVFQTLGLGTKRGNIVSSTSGKVSSIYGSGTQTKGASFFEGVGIKSQQETRSNLFVFNQIDNKGPKGFLGGSSGKQTPLSETFSAPPKTFSPSIKPPTQTNTKVFSSSGVFSNQNLKGQQQNTPLLSSNIKTNLKQEVKIDNKIKNDFKVDFFSNIKTDSISRGSSKIKTKINSEIQSKPFIEIQSINRNLNKPLQKQLLDIPILPPITPRRKAPTPFGSFRFGGALNLPKRINFPSGRRSRKVPRSKTTSRISPSFTGSILDLRTGIPDIDPLIGISPLKIRGLPQAKRSKKNKKRK